MPLLGRAEAPLFFRRGRNKKALRPRHPASRHFCGSIFQGHLVASTFSVRSGIRLHYQLQQCFMPSDVQASEPPNEQQQQEELQARIGQLREQAWREGLPGLELKFVYLMTEIKFDRDNPNAWHLDYQGYEVEQQERAWRRELEDIEALLQSNLLVWNQMGIQPKLYNAREIQPVVRFADLFFLSFTVPSWVSPVMRNNFIEQHTNILRLYRRANPEALIIAITKHPTFRLKKDPLFLQWNDLSVETTGIGKKGAITRLVAQQLSSKATLKAYIEGRHTTHKLAGDVRKVELQKHYEALQKKQVDVNLLIVTHPGLHSSYADAVVKQIKHWHFSSVEVIRQTDLKFEKVKEYDFFILIQCGFPEDFRNAPDAHVQHIARRTYRFTGWLPEKMPPVQKRPFEIRNKLEQYYLDLQGELKTEATQPWMMRRASQYEEFWKLAQEEATNNLQIESIEERLLPQAEAYYALVHMALMEATRHVHSGTRFGGIMRNLTRYLIVDDFRTDLIDYLVEHKFPRTRVKMMSSLELFRLFNKFKRDNPNLPAAKAYQQFMRKEETFSQFEVVLVNSWNVETDGTLNVKLRLAPVPAEGETAVDPSEVTLTSRNLHELIRTKPDELLEGVLGAAALKDKTLKEQRESVERVIKAMISKDGLNTLSKIMGVKKGKQYRLFQIDMEMGKLLDRFKSEEEKLEGEEAAPAPEPPDNEAEATGDEEFEPPEIETLDEWFVPLLKHRLQILEAMSLGCAVRNGAQLDNIRAGRFLEEEQQLYKESPEQILEMAQVALMTLNSSFPLEGVNAVFPEAVGFKRIQKFDTLLSRRDLEELRFALFIIDLPHFSMEVVHQFLRNRNRSRSSHVPVVFHAPVEFRESLDPTDEAVLWHLSGVRTNEAGEVQAMPLYLDSLDNQERITHHLRGLLNL